jgi:hypothetical protein
MMKQWIVCYHYPIVCEVGKALNTKKKDVVAKVVAITS